MENFDYKATITDVADFVNQFNKFRLANKNKWIVYFGFFNGQDVRIKAFGTWNQLIKVNGINHGGTHGHNVKAWRLEITNALNCTIT